MERLKLNIQRFADEPTYYTSGNLIDEEALYEYHDKMKTYVNGKIPTKTSDLTNDSNFLENKVFAVEDIMAITSSSDTTYSELAFCIGSNIPFQISEVLGNAYCYDVINTYNSGITIAFEYVDTSNSVVKITLEGRSNITVTRTTTPYQEEITSTNKLDYSLIDNTPTIPTVPTTVSSFTNDAGYITSSYHDSSKQDTLVSGTNIKTINNQSLLGSGNINISSGGGTQTDVQINGSSIVSNDVANIVVEGTYNATTNKIATEDTIIDTTGELSLLQTQTQVDLVHAINEVNTQAGVNENSIGDLSTLDTSDKGDLVSAINEVLGEIPEDTGWRNITLPSGISATTLGGTPQCRKIGNHVFVRGGYAGTKGSSGLKLGTLPTGWKPQSQLYWLCAGTGARTYRVFINTSGEIWLEWAYPFGSNSAWTGTFSWIDFKADFFID